MKYLLAFLLIAWHQPLVAQMPDSPHKPILINYVPASFSNSFSLNMPPVLRISPGDTVRTETIDASGHDKNGVRRQKPGNPLTGPFYINDAQEGDVLKVSLLKISLNRIYAFTTEAFVSRSMPDSLARQFKKPRLIKWKLDVNNGFALLDSSYGYDHLSEFKLPLHPFLGCIGVAPANKKNEILSFFEGEFGGNLDYSSISEHSVVYLPVFHDGAYLYIGDGHALQGDGEIAGNALETSLDVEFTVSVIKGANQKITSPVIEDSIYLMSLGVARSLDEAIKKATSGLFNWLQQHYHITAAEATQVLSTGIEYAIAEIADPDVVVAAKIKKQLLIPIR